MHLFGAGVAPGIHVPSTSVHPPFAAYKGTGPYVFVSYAHKDAALVFPELSRIESWGFNVWYDEGIDPGNEWPEEIAQAIMKCSLFIIFISVPAVMSVNCRNELNLALNLEKPFVSVHLMHTDLIKLQPGIALRIESMQAVLKHKMDEASYERKLRKVLDGALTENSVGPTTPLPPSPAPIAAREASSSNAAMLLIALGLAFVLVLCIGLGLGCLYAFGNKAAALTGVVPVNAVDPTVKPLTDSLGLKFVLAGTPGVLFSVYDVRLQDFQDFVKETSRDMSGGIYVVGKNDYYMPVWKLDPHASWDNPGFQQKPDDPVVGVNWYDAEAFCQWLTNKEHKSGTLDPKLSYRLPKDEEWSRAVGTGKYPWGDAWPPPKGAGNYADEASAPAGSLSPHLPGNDGYSNTSPVGSFSANSYGLFDMGGNVYQLCEDSYDGSLNSPEIKQELGLTAAEEVDSYKVLRGGSWRNGIQAYLLSEARYPLYEGARGDNTGFRLVLAGQQ